MSYAIYILVFLAVLQGGFLVFKGQGLKGFYQSKLILQGKRIRDGVTFYTKEIKEKEWIRSRRSEKMDSQIYESISFLRNITALGKGRQVSADFIIGQLAMNEGILQPVYIKMLSLLRLGKKQEAIAAFSEEVTTSMGQEFGGLLLQWDDMDPAELTEILISHQKNIKEVKSTIQKRRDEMISDLVYLPVVVNVFVIFINFIYVAYLMEQQALLRMLF